jgi:hypothetical protein
MEGIAKRIHDGAHGGGDPVQGHHIDGWHGHVVCECAVSVYADDLRILADVRVASSALPAVSTDDVSLGSHFLSDGQGLSDVFADFHDLTGEFVADHNGGSNPPLGPLVPIGYMEISTAHSRVVHSNEHVEGTAPRFGRVGNGQAGLAFWLDDGAHVS